MNLQKRSGTDELDPGEILRAEKRTAAIELNQKAQRHKIEVKERKQKELADALVKQSSHNYVKFLQ